MAADVTPCLSSSENQTGLGQIGPVFQAQVNLSSDRVLNSNRKSRPRRAAAGSVHTNVRGGARLDNSRQAENGHPIACPKANFVGIAQG